MKNLFEAAKKGVSSLAEELKPFRNLIFRIWNEFDYRTVSYFKDFN